MTLVVGGLGIVGMVLGSEHDRSDLLVEMAQPRMEQYLTVLGPQGEFNESVGVLRLPAIPRPGTSRRAIR